MNNRFYITVNPPKTDKHYRFEDPEGQIVFHLVEEDIPDNKVLKRFSRFLVDCAELMTVSTERNVAMTIEEADHKATFDYLYKECQIWKW